MARQKWSDTEVRATLDQIDRAQRWMTCSLIAAGVFELAGLLGMALTVNLSDPTHRVLIAMTVLVYGTLAMGLVALGVLLSRNSLRVLQAIELAAASRSE
jgi:hypothetical protein